MEFVMMDKKPHIKPYLYAMLAGFGAISLSIIFFFLIYRFDGFGDAISTLTGILMRRPETVTRLSGRDGPSGQTAD